MDVEIKKAMHSSYNLNQSSPYITQKKNQKTRLKKPNIGRYFFRTVWDTFFKASIALKCTKNAQKSINSFS